MPGLLARRWPAQSTVRLLILLPLVLLLLKAEAPLLPSLLLLLLLLLPLKEEQLPPGPWGLPVIGHLPLLSPSSPHESLAAMVLTYGKVFSCSCS